MDTQVMESIIVPPGLPYDERSLAGTPARELPPIEILRIRHLVNVLGLKDIDVRTWQGALGRLTGYPERPMLTAHPIVQQQFADWMSGAERVPRWRMAALVVTLEFLGCLRRYEINKALDNPALTEEERRQATFHSSQLRYARSTLARLEAIPDIQQYLPLFRLGLDKRLEADATKTALDRLRYRLWREVNGVADNPVRKPQRKQK